MYQSRRLSCLWEGDVAGRTRCLLCPVIPVELKSKAASGNGGTSARESPRSPRSPIEASRTHNRLARSRMKTTDGLGPHEKVDSALQLCSEIRHALIDVEAVLVIAALVEL